MSSQAVEDCLYSNLYFQINVNSLSLTSLTRVTKAYGKDSLLRIVTLSVGLQRGIQQ